MSKKNDINPTERIPYFLHDVLKEYVYSNRDKDRLLIYYEILEHYLNELREIIKE